MIKEEIKEHPMLFWYHVDFLQSWKYNLDENCTPVFQPYEEGN